TAWRATRARFTPTRVGTTQALIKYHVGRSVHPHARGDNAMQHRMGERDGGSPPRAWGQRRRAATARPARRFTPTRVGTTPSSRAWASAMAVHPHARGDNADGPQRLARPGGSPPRAWGQHVVRA